MGAKGPICRPLTGLHPIAISPTPDPAFCPGRVT